jgi:hypothetical protein
MAPTRLLFIESRIIDPAVEFSVLVPATLNPLSSVMSPAAVVMSKSPVIPPNTVVDPDATYPPVPPITDVAVAPLPELSLWAEIVIVGVDVYPLPGLSTFRR